MAFSFLTVASSLLLSTPFIAQIEPPSYLVTPRTCPIALPAGEIDGETISCGILTVPENYDDPDGRQIDIAYAVLHSRSLSPASDPVIDLRGGPGGSVIDTNPLMLRSSIYEPLRQTRDIVLFDQRGAKFSSRLACAPFFFGATVLREQDTEFAELFEQLEENLEDAPLTDEETILLHAICSQGLQDHGFDLNQYNTPNSAQDVVNLVEALGYEAFNLYGISYGTYLAMQVMRDHPERIRSVVLDSTLPPQVNKYEVVPRFYEASMLHLFEDCERDEACREAYPNLRDRYGALLISLRDHPITIPQTSTDSAVAIADDTTPYSITPDSLVTLVTRMNQDPRVAPYIPLIVHELEQGITTTYEGVDSGDIFTQAAPEPVEPGSAEDYLLRSRDLQVEADRLLREQAELAQLQRSSSQWVQEVQAQIETLPDAEQSIATVNLLGVGYQTDLPRDRTTLAAFLDETFSDDTAVALHNDLATMANEEIRHIYEVVEDTLDTIYPLDAEITFGMFRTMDCREQVSFSDPAKTAATYLDLEFPLLGESLFALSEQAYAACSVWPIEPASDGEHQVLQSDIPTLVLGGRYDVQTPIFMGIQAMEGLTEGTFIEFPNTGHGVIAYSQCAQDIGVAFINDSTQTLDTTCTEDLQPDFVLPSPDSE